MPELAKAKRMKHPAFLIMLSLRLGESFVFFLNPWIAWLLATFLDMLDSIPWRDMARLTSFEYEVVDRYVDSFIAFVMLLVAVGSVSFGLLSALLVFRLVGSVLFIRTKNQHSLIFFANFFEAYWLWAIALPLINLPTWGAFLVSKTGLVFLLVLKMVQELIKHHFGPEYIFPHTDRLWNKSRLMT